MNVITIIYGSQIVSVFLFLFSYCIGLYFQSERDWNRMKKKSAIYVSTKYMYIARVTVKLFKKPTNEKKKNKQKKKVAAKSARQSLHFTSHWQQRILKISYYATHNSNNNTETRRIFCETNENKTKQRKQTEQSACVYAFWSVKSNMRPYLMTHNHQYS